MSGERIWANSAVAGLVLVAGLLIFPGLGDRYLWDDEAETALLAKNVLRFGVPVAWDGVSLISQECGADYDSNYLWRQTPWLPIYLTAASFWLFGAGTLAARMPFALLGLLAIPSMYVLARRLFPGRLTAVVAAGSLVVSVPFLLHVRQCRYYALAIFAAIWILYFFFLLRRSPRLAAAGLALSLTVLLHTSHLLFFGAIAGLTLGFVVAAFDRAVVPWLLAALGAPVIVNASWLVGTDLGGKSGALLSLSSTASFLANLARYAARIELYAFSALLLITVLLAIQVARREPIDFASAESRVSLFLVVSAIAHLLVVATVPFVFFRYVLTLLPVLALLQARILQVMATQSRVLAVTVLLIAILPDRADLIRGRFSTTLAKYVDEITHHVPGPIEGIVTRLNTRARPGDRVYISYGDLPLRFYTTLDVRGGQGCQSLDGWPAPDWVIVRYFFRFRPVAPGAKEDADRTLQYLRSVVTIPPYRQIDLPVADTIWENIPEPDRHVFRDRGNRPKITLYERVRG